MTTSVQPSRTRLARYFAGVVVNGVLLVLINGRPGWAVVPFLTPEFASVVGVVDLALVAGAVTAFVHLWRDPEWLVALDGLVTTCAGLVALVRLWQVFPFDFGGASAWAAVARIVLAAGFTGSVLGLAVGLVTLVRAGLRKPRG